MVVPYFELDPYLGGESVTPASATALCALPGMAMPKGAAERAFAQSVWRAARPAWTQDGWWGADLRPEVRALMLMRVGPDLQRHLTYLAAADRAGGHQRGECPVTHPAASAIERLGTPGSPCACQVVIVAAWAAVASWVSAQADEAVLAAAGDKAVEEFVAPDRPHLGTVVDASIEELGPALRVSPGSARYRLGGMRRVAALPQLQAAVTTGLMIGWHAHMLATDLRHLSDDDRATVVNTLLARLRSRRATGFREWTVTDLRAQAKRIAAGLDLDLATRRKECHRDRGVRLRLHGQGAATLSADLADDVAARIFRRLTAIAHGLDTSCHGEGTSCDGEGTSCDGEGSDSSYDGEEGARTLDQRRADVFTDLLLASPGSPGLDRGTGTGARDTAALADVRAPGGTAGPTNAAATGDTTAATGDTTAATGETTAATGDTTAATGDTTAATDAVAPASNATLAGSEVAVIIDIATLLRLADQPGEVVGSGPVPAEIARQLAADARWRAWITRATATGTQVIATSPGTYRPTAAVARLVRAREPECRMPGCRSTITDLDHVVPFPDGPTIPSNLGPLCRRHHRLKTHTRWRQRAHSGSGPDPGPADSPDEAIGWTWTTPSGISHTDEPEPPFV